MVEKGQSTSRDHQSNLGPSTLTTCHLHPLGGWVHLDRLALKRAPRGFRLCGSGTVGL